MKVGRALFVVGLIGALAGCGPGIPSAGNYATVYGRVTDATSQNGVAGAVVTVNVVLSGTSDASGNFKITNVPTGPWSYAVVVPAGYTTPPGSDSAAPLAPGEMRQLNITLTHG
jgi:hypothetical protein